MLKRKREEVEKESLKEMSFFVDVNYQDITKAKEEYMNKVIRKRLHYMRLCDDIIEKNDARLLAFDSDHIRKAYEACADNKFNLSPLMELTDNINEQFYIYSVCDEKYFSHQEINIDKELIDVYSSHDFAQVAKTYSDGELRKAMFNNKYFYVCQRTSLANILLKPFSIYGNDEDEHVKKLLNGLLTLRKSGFDIKFDLGQKTEYSESIRNLTPDMKHMPKYEINTIRHGLVNNPIFLNECLVNGYFEIDSQFDYIVEIAREQLYRYDTNSEAAHSALSDTIRTLYLLMKEIDKKKGSEKVEKFDKIAFFDDYKSVTKIYNKVFANKEFMIFYNKLEKEIYPHKYAKRLSDTN